MSSAVHASQARTVTPVLALLVNAFVWGVSWWPFRRLQAMGLHPLWATAVVYLLSVVAIGLWRRSAWRQVITTPALWLIFLASGTTNAAFNWAVSIGDVVRVVLLFYLMPLWALLLARVVLKERMTRVAVLRVLLAMAGVVYVLVRGVMAMASGRDVTGEQSQKWMQRRVLFQAIAIIIVILILAVAGASHGS